LSEAFFVVRRNERDVMKKYVNFYVTYRLFFPVLTKLEFLVRFSKKYSNTKFHENPSNGSRQTDRLGEANKLVVFRNFANATRNRINLLTYFGDASELWAE